MDATATKVITDSTLVVITYNEDDVRPRTANLLDIAEALRQTHHYFLWAYRIAGARGFENRYLEPDEGQTFRAFEVAPLWQPLSIRMESPLAITVTLTPEAWAAGALGLILLGEQLATLGVRTTKKRAQEIYEAEWYKKATQLLQGRTEAAMQDLTESEPRIPGARGDRRPFSIDVVVQDEQDDPVERLTQPPGLQVQDIPNPGNRDEPRQSPPENPDGPAQPPKPE
jgi:hypothetical protein